MRRTRMKCILTFVLVSFILASSGLEAVFNANVDFGTVGNGTVDDTVRLQKFLNAVTGSHGEGVIRSGDYRITAMLKINNAHHFKVRGLSQTGGKANVGSYGVRILWDGPANGIPIRLTNVRDSEISNLFIGAKPRRTILAALDIDGDNSTYNVFENLMIDRYAGSITTGVRTCATAPTGCDLLLFRGCLYEVPVKQYGSLEASLNGTPLRARNSLAPRMAFVLPTEVSPCIILISVTTRQIYL